MPMLKGKAFYDSLPRKRMASGVIFTQNGKMLIVKRSFDGAWLVPGGIVEKDESPLMAAKREVKEELGNDFPVSDLLGIDYVADHGQRGDSLQFIFYGRDLGSDEVEKIKIDGKEIVEYKFVKVGEAMDLLETNLAKRIPSCFKQIGKDGAVYLENGKVNKRNLRKRLI